MNEILEKILDLIKLSFKKQPYEFSVMQLNGTEENLQLKIANSIEYTFINSGNTLVIINDRFFLFPQFAQRGVHKHTFTINKNEVDNSVWEYRFESLEGKHFVAAQESSNTPNSYLLSKYNSIGQAAPDFNLMQVIVKRVSRN